MLIANFGFDEAFAQSFARTREMRQQQQQFEQNLALEREMQALRERQFEVDAETARINQDLAREELKVAGVRNYLDIIGRIKEIEALEVKTDTDRENLEILRGQRDALIESVGLNNDVLRARAENIEASTGLTREQAEAQEISNGIERRFGEQRARFEIQSMYNQNILQGLEGDLARLQIEAFPEQFESEIDYREAQAELARARARAEGMGGDDFLTQFGPSVPATGTDVQTGVTQGQVQPEAQAPMGEPGAMTDAEADEEAAPVGGALGAIGGYLGGAMDALGAAGQFVDQGYRSATEAITRPIARFLVGEKALVDPEVAKSREQLLVGGPPIGLSFLAGGAGAARLVAIPRNVRALRSQAQGGGLQLPQFSQSTERVLRREAEAMARSRSAGTTVRQQGSATMNPSRQLPPGPSGVSAGTGGMGGPPGYNLGVPAPRMGVSNPASVPNVGITPRPMQPSIGVTNPVLPRPTVPVQSTAARTLNEMLRLRALRNLR